MTATLTDAIEAAKAREEILKLDAGDKRVAADLAKRIQLPAKELSADIRTRLDAFNSWAIARQARRCPAKPATVALFVLEQAALGVPVQHILAQLDAIEQQHDKWLKPNPVRTAPVRQALEGLTKVPPPRGWPKEDKVLFATLDPDIRRIIAEREILRDREIRRLQNKAAAERRQTNGAAKPVQSNKDHDNDCSQTQ